MRVFAPVVIGGCFAFFACIPDPKGDFEDYTERTTSFRESTAGDASIDSVAPTEAVNGLYLAACLSTLAAGRIDRVLRFYTETAYTPKAGGGGGTLTMRLTAMKLGPSNGPPASFSKTETVGTTYTINAAPVDARGVYPGDLGRVDIPGASNPISGRDIVIEGVRMPGRFEPAQFCSQLWGQVTRPTEITLDGNASTCLFKPATEGGPLPVFTVPEFEPGCPL